MDTGQADMANQQGNRQGDKGTNKGTNRGGDRVRTEALQQIQGETDKVTREPTGPGVHPTRSF